MMTLDAMVIEMGILVAEPVVEPITLTILVLFHVCRLDFLKHIENIKKLVCSSFGRFMLKYTNFAPSALVVI